MRNKIIQLAITVLISLCFTGCGNKGDLYLPKQPDDKSTQTPNNN